MCYPVLMDIKRTDAKGRLTGFDPQTHYFITGPNPQTGAYSVRPVTVVDVAPADEADAINAVHELLLDHFDPEDSGVDLIDLAAMAVRRVRG